MLILPVLSKNPTEFQVPLTGIIHQFVTAESLDYGVGPYFKPFLEHEKIPAFRPFVFIGMPSRKVSGEELIETLVSPESSILLIA